MILSRLRHLTIPLFIIALLLTGCSDDGLSDNEVYALLASLTNTVSSWTHPADISDYISPDGDTVYSPQVAMDDDGNAIIVWYQSDGSKLQIYKSEYRNGTWTNPSSISDNISIDGYDAIYPQVAMDSDGNAIITWSQHDGSNSQIFKSEYRNGSWTNPSSISDNISPNNYSASHPQVAMDDNGNAIITWYQYDASSKYQIFKSEYRSGSWDHPDNIADNISPDNHDATYPQVAMDNSGNAIITWEQIDGTDRIFKSEYRSGSWDHPDDITDYIFSGIYAHVAMDNNGNAIITWQGSDGSNHQIYKSEYRSGSWTHPSGPSDNISPDGYDVQESQVAMDDNGNAILTWYQFVNATDFQIFKSEYRDGSWTHPSGLNDYISHGDYIAALSQVAMDNNGNAILTWYQSDSDSNFQIFKSEYRDGGWTHPSSITDNISPDGYHAFLPQVAMDNNGNAIIVWQQYVSASITQIFKSEYR